MGTPSFCVVEDGSAFTNSNAYWDVDSVVSYLSNNGSTDFQNYSNTQQAQAIIRSTQYVEKRFKRKYRGIRQTVEQALGWPRIGAFDDDNFTIFGIPYQLQYAVAEYAARAARVGVLAPDPLRTVPPQDLSQPTPGTSYAQQIFTQNASNNFTAGDTVTIGLRVYTFVTSNPSVDGQVLVGGTFSASLLNLYAAINNEPFIATGLFTASTNFLAGDSLQIGNRSYNFVATLSPQDVTDTVVQVVVGVDLATSLVNVSNCINFVGTVGETWYALQRDQNVTATYTGTTLLVSANTNQNISNFETVAPTSVPLAANTQAGSWSSTTLVLSGGSGTNYFVLSADPNVTATVAPTSIVVTDASPNGNTVATLYHATGTSAGAWGAGMLAGGAVVSTPETLILGPTRTLTARVGPLETTQSFDGMAQRAIQDERTTRAAQSTLINDYYIPEYPEADLWLEQVLRNPSSGTRMVRG